MAGVEQWLRRHGSAANRAGMARYGIRSRVVHGVSMTAMRPLVRRLGRDQALAEALWQSGSLEARLLASFVAEPATMTPAAMNRWVRDFDNWAVVDSTCLRVFSRSRHAWGRVHAWSRRRDEYVRRAAFSLLAALAVHDRTSPDARFAAELPRLVAAAVDDRPYVRKAVNWALRQIGKRSPGLREAAVACAARIGALDTPGARWIAADALAELTRPDVLARLAARGRATHPKVTKARRERHT